MKRIQLEIDDELHRRAKTQASARAITLTRLVREAVDEFVVRLEAAPRQRSTEEGDAS